MRAHHLNLIGFVFAIALAIVFAQTPRARADEPTTKPQSAFQGMVKDSHGLPIAGASVQLQQDNGSGSAKTTTNAQGKFVLSTEKAGVYVLRVQKEGFRETRETLNLPFKEKQCEIVLVPSHAGDKTSSGVEFSDNPGFTIAGVTDWTAAGGHGSDVNLRTSEALAKQTQSLAETAPGSAQLPNRTSEELRQKREELQKKLATDNSANLHRQLGDVDEQLNDALSAEHEYQRAAEIDPSEPNYFAWATELLLHRAVQPALEVFTKAVSVFPHSERMLAGLGAALYASGLYAQAAERLCDASDLKPRDPTPYLFLGKMVQASPQPLPCAEQKLARFLHDQPSNAFANYYYALALWKQTADSSNAQQINRIESLLNAAITDDPNFAEAYLQLGIVDNAAGNAAKSIAEYEKAVAADPKLAEAHFRLGQAYKKSGELEKAQREFQTYEQIQKTEAAAVEQQRREILQFVVVFKEQPKNLHTN